MKTRARKQQLPGTARRPLPARGLSFLLLCIALVASVPVFSIAVLTGGELRESELSLARARLSSLVHELSARQQLISTGIEMLFRSIMTLPGLREGGPEVDGTLRKLMERNPFLTTILVADSEGRVVATGSDTRDFSIEDRPYFIRAMDTRSFTCGPVITSRASGLTALPYSLPSEDGDLILVGSLILSRYSDYLPAGVDMPGVMIEGFDTEGMRLFTVPADDGKPLAGAVDEAFKELADSMDAYQGKLVDASGRSLLVSLGSVQLEGDPDSIVRILAYMPRDMVMKRFEGLNLRNGFISVLFTALSLAMAFMLAKFGVTRRVDGIVAACDSMRDGDYGARTGVSYAGNELGTIARSLDELAAAVARRDRERDAAEEALSRSLAEREALLREVHHRVNNNFQVIASMLSLQAHEMDEPHVLEAYEIGNARIQAMAQVHEGFYESPDMARLDLVRYARDLSAKLAASHAVVPARVEGTEGCCLADLERAVPFGLFLNEALSHCYRRGAGGDVTVTLDCIQGGVLSLRVAYECPEERNDTDSGAAIGPGIVEALAAQLHGVLENSVRPDGRGGEIVLRCPR